MTDLPDGPRAVSLPVGERLAVLDILRGVALLGILVVNVPGFGSSFFAEADPSRLWPGTADRVVAVVRDTLFADKFNALFTLLFGIGFTIQFARLQQSLGERATRVYLRRLGALLLIGLLHGVLLWPGDVLNLYALLGIVLVLGLRHASERTLIALAGAALLFPAFLPLLQASVLTPEQLAGLDARNQALEAAENLAYGHGGFGDMVVRNARTMWLFFSDPFSLLDTARWLVLLGLSLLVGVVVGRRHWVQRLDELMPEVRRWTVPTLVLGLGFALAVAVIESGGHAQGASPLNLLGSLCHGLSRLSLMAFYALVVVRLSRHPRAARWLRPFALTGRLPLSQYLLQSALCLAIFRGWGLGLWMQVGPALGLALAFGLFFLVQVPLSAWWLRRYERGPMEALWGRMTYGPQTR